jgi:hypothetical protein
MLEVGNSPLGVRREGSEFGVRPVLSGRRSLDAPYDTKICLSACTACDLRPISMPLRAGLQSPYAGPPQEAPEARRAARLGQTI